MEAVAEIEERMQRARRSFDDLKAEMARTIVGHEDLIEQVSSRLSAAVTACWRGCRDWARRSWCVASVRF